MPHRPVQNGGGGLMPVALLERASVVPEPGSIVGHAPTVRIASLANASQSLADGFKQLPEAEKARAVRYARQADRERFILGRLLVRSLLATLFGIDGADCALDTDINGKPCLRARPDIAFNISHSGDLVIAAAAAGLQLGVDVERHRADVDFEGVSRLMFAPCEREAVLKGSPDERMARFFRQWSLKEALVKALGTGLMREPRRFAIDQTVSPPRVTFVGDGPDDVGHGWSINEIAAAKGYSAAVAWRSANQAHIGAA